MSNLNLENVQVFQHKQSNKCKGSIGIVSKGNTARISFDKTLIESIGNPKTIQIGFLEDANGKSLVIGEVLGQGNSFDLKKSSNKSTIQRVIYNADLTKEIISFFDLDFFNCSSKTFGSHVIEMIDEKKVAVISK